MSLLFGKKQIKETYISLSEIALFYCSTHGIEFKKHRSTIAQKIQQALSWQEVQ